ncbi:hypothetical protein [Halomicrobium salinisoli]|uniref:hypothetical protein n=1 Tax=Halomicrobium salinisoli TaxID=2878391 RepID=UPI001CF0B6D5|nr:hypothetical protein [Halomicrobium salinisoli]
MTPNSSATAPDREQAAGRQCADAAEVDAAVAGGRRVVERCGGLGRFAVGGRRVVTGRRRL